MSKDFIGSIRPQLQEMDLDLALAEDAVRAVLRIVTDGAMNGELRQIRCSPYLIPVKGTP